MSLSNAITKLQAKQDLSSSEMHAVFAEIFTQNCDANVVKSFLVLLHEKGESEQEILGAAKYLREQGEKVVSKHKDLIDCCGTGGDRKGTFNISTAVAFVLAGAGCHVAKHGNRAITSQSGSADILTELGVNIQASKEVMAKAIDEIGIGFLFAPNYHPLLKKMADVRKAIPHRTIFNLLGPLLNPAGAKRQLIGVFDKALVHKVAEILKSLGSDSVVAVHAEDGSDEFSLTGSNTVSRLSKGQIQDFAFDPRTSGYAYCKENDLLGGSAADNAKRLRQILKGHSQPLDHVVHINAAWGLIAAGKTEDFMEALLMAQDAISSGRAYRKLEELIEFTN